MIMVSAGDTNAADEEMGVAPGGTGLMSMMMTTRGTVLMCLMLPTGGTVLMCLGRHILVCI